MFPLCIASFGALLLSFYLALSLPQEMSIKSAITTDVSATNFLTYRDAVSRYYAANPTALGTIPDSSLTFAPGYIRNNLWSNTISGGVLYVYGTAPGEVLNNIYQKSLNSSLVGFNSSGILRNQLGSSAGVTIPAPIPSGALVFVGG